MNWRRVFVCLGVLAPMVAAADKQKVVSEKPKRVQSARWSVLLTVVESYQIQGKRTLQTTPDSTYNLSDFKGASPFFAAGAEYIINSAWAARLSLVRRRTRLVGDALPEGSATLYRLQVEQQLLGGEVGIRYTPTWLSGFSFILNGELARVTSAKLDVLEGSPVDDSQMEKPIYFSTTVGVLYDWRVHRHWSIEPGLRVGAIVTAIPAMLLAEGVVSLKWH